jgi:cellulose synthase/poly-beta-1,6-N-acetylglucosamine synthase-like glycosyltransferase
LTEDLDLSYRAQLRSWRVGYLPDVVVPAELPSQVEAFKKQQFRWAKGSFQVVRKILPEVLKQPDLSWYVRLMAVLHLTGYFVHPLMLTLLVLTLPVGLLNPDAIKAFPLSMIAAFGPPLLYLSAAASQTVPLRERLKLLPLLVLIGFGLSLNTSIAVFEGLVGKVGTFVRTPKLNLMNTRKGSKTFDQTYLEPISKLVWVEIGLAVYAIATIVILYPRLGWGIIPWMLAYVLGYSYIAGLNLLQHSPRLARWVSKHLLSGLEKRQTSENEGATQTQTSPKTI